FRGVLPAAWLGVVIAGFIFFHLGNNTDMRDRHRAVVHPDLIAVGVIAMMMRIESKTNRLVRGGLDLRNDLLRARGKVAVYDEHIIIKDYPAIVTMAVNLEIAFVKINIRRDLLGLIHLGHGKNRG